MLQLVSKLSAGLLNYTAVALDHLIGFLLIIFNYQQIFFHCPVSMGGLSHPSPRYATPMNEWKLSSQVSRYTSFMQPVMQASPPLSCFKDHSPALHADNSRE